jgi:hypothetical protein
MIYVIAAVLLWLIVPRLWRQWSNWKQMSAAERSFAIRFAAFSAVLTVILVIAMLYLPHKERALLILPLFAIGASLAKWRHSSRERLRREAEEATSFERARRIN